MNNLISLSLSPFSFIRHFFSSFIYGKRVVGVYYFLYFIRSSSAFFDLNMNNLISLSLSPFSFICHLHPPHATRFPSLSFPSPLFPFPFLSFFLLSSFLIPSETFPPFHLIFHIYHLSKHSLSSVFRLYSFPLI